ncbi:glycoside hydrolase family 16 protein [Dysgonomonadaceae bacterium zrk40]|nr:glycoside hydrolase family 16 protein [Dysgonomonadaceae bacterium zrk40]
MKKIFSFIFTLLFLFSCNVKTESMEVRETLQSFGFGYNGKTYLGYINHEAGTITIGGIEYTDQITGVVSHLGQGGTLTPNDSLLLAQLSGSNTLTVTLDGESCEYQLLLPDWVGKSSEGYPQDHSWQLVWEEQFEGSEINWDVWSKTPRAGSDWNNTMSDADELYEVNDGVLSLKAIANTSYPDDPSPYLTGGLWGNQKLTFDLGRIDVRARYGSGQGFWPAIWMLGDGAGWPTGGELDIMEHLNFDSFVYQTVHSDYTQHVSKSNPQAHGTQGINSEVFNIYSVEVHTDEVVFLVNDQVTFRYPRLSPAVDGQFPFTEHNYYLILSAQLGGSWVGNVNSAHLPLSLDIDWIRFYER